MGILRPVRAAFRTIVTLRIALSVRRNLLIECLAQHHQLAILGRSDRRFRPPDRLFWVGLRRWWPGWKNALVLGQPATVARWHREGLRECWSRQSRRRPGRRCIDADLRALIRRMATENHLWGAPRIHGELLKLGLVVSERTVSRYLPDLGTAPSQTWRTSRQPPRRAGSDFLGDIEPTWRSVDASDARLCLVPSIRDGSCVIHRWVAVEWRPSFPRTSPGARVAQELPQRRRASSNKDPPHGVDRRISFQGLWAEETSTGSRHQLS
jgi:Homeodomain-like domain